MAKARSQCILEFKNILIYQYCCYYSFTVTTYANTDLSAA